MQYKTIFLSSGKELPRIKENNIYIGYQPIENKYNKKNVYWGLSFAPTFKLNTKNKIKRENDSIFIALGGHKNNLELKILINAINEIKEIKKIYILKSPVNENLHFNENEFRSDLKINILNNIKSIESFLLKSTIVIASYGNLCFEALSFNAPLCIVAQKPFQNDYSKLLERKKLAVSIGMPSIKGLNKIRDSIKSFYVNRHVYTSESYKIPSNGLEKIAKIIMNYL